MNIEEQDQNINEHNEAENRADLLDRIFARTRKVIITLNIIFVTLLFAIPITGVQLQNRGIQIPETINAIMIIAFVLCLLGIFIANVIWRIKVIAMRIKNTAQDHKPLKLI